METSIAELLISNSPVPAMLAGEKGEIIFFTESAAQVLGSSLTGKSISDFLDQHPLPETFTTSTAIRLTADPGAVLRSVIKADGKKLLVSWKETEIGQGRKAIYFRDIDTQIRYILKVKEQQQTEHDLFRSSHIRNGNLDLALREIAVRSAETMEVKRVNIWIIGEGFNSIQSLVNYDTRNGGFLDNVSLYRHQFPNYFSLMQTEEIIPTEDALNDPKTQELRDNYLVPMGILSLLDAPVRIEGKMAGVICFEDTDRKRNWNVSELNFSASIAQTVAQTLETHRRQQAQLLLEQALAEKKLLLAEVNHRIKNNFALIGDLVRLQEGKTKDEFHHGLFSEIRTRLVSMTMIHRQLYMSDTMAAVNFRDFLIDLAAHFRSTFSADGIEISTMLDNCRLPIGKAILCGLVVNELLTNSCRHAFKDQKKGLVRLQLSTISEKIQVSVSDNGSMVKESAEGIGSELISELISKLGATIERNTTSGTRTTLTFSIN
jgi:two-component sensor histidine kinase